MSDYDNEDDIRFGRSFLSVGQVDDIIAKRDALRQALYRLADPDDDLINRGMSVAAATGAVLTYTQMHDICQALADELEATDG